MKKLGLFFLLLACIGLQSCKKNETPKEVAAPPVQDEKPMSVTCYKALYENDTIDLKINILKNKKVTGDMVMKIIDMPYKTGKISGEFHGDTLFVDYTFIQGTNDKKIFKNPMAMLKKGDELILGSGKIETYLGRSYFAKDTPIDFEKVKYKFTTVDCVNK
ncbi:hypothetical protein [Flavobacterium taihuense]|uniref:Lipoprotein n=1 Tax=Flavobacterium taihuense TaxID=2857508 RepID=A0ABS6XZP3_9FLAO|nr:hypothetical protein [Flavobacterium taihuense]MBW4361756.1 hypothetical protein [Flavobacterium taihuense]